MVEPRAPSACGLLTPCRIRDVFHYAPLHYILFIARSQALLSKNELQRIGYEPSHFRRTSHRLDSQRGFSNYVHLSLAKHPPILRAKLTAGFPHFEIRIPATHVETLKFHLCRYNIAKSRNPKTGRRPAPEGRASGRYYGEKHLPTAETVTECKDLLVANLGRNMIEVLVPTSIALTADTELIFFSEIDRDLAKKFLYSMKLRWQLRLAQNLSYTPAARYVARIERFLEQAIIDPEWRGDGVDFDNV
jgi:hypothetical protein